jgi:acyl dehydratase
VIALRERGERHGVATLDLQIHNQRGQIVMRCEFSLLIRKTRLVTAAISGSEEVA